MYFKAQTFVCVSFAANAVRRKGCKMKIRIQHDNKSIYLEVSDEDCTVMIDADYEDCLSSVCGSPFCTRDYGGAFQQTGVQQLAQN